jgi:hypothetical protein
VFQAKRTYDVIHEPQYRELWPGYISPIVNMRPKNEVLALMQDGSRKGSLYLKGCVKQENAFFL